MPTAPPNRPRRTILQLQRGQRQRSRSSLGHLQKLGRDEPSEVPPHLLVVHRDLLDLSRLAEHRDRVRIVEFGGFGARREVVEDEMEEGEEGVVLDLEDVLLELSPPGEVLGPTNVVAVPSERAEVAVEPGCGARGDVVDAEGFKRGLESRDGGDARDVVDGDHVNRVVDVGDRAELDAALDEAPEEVVRVRDGRGRVSDDVGGANDGAGESSSTCLEEQTLRDPLRLAVSTLQPRLSSIEGIRLGAPRPPFWTMASARRTYEPFSIAAVDETNERTLGRVVAASSMTAIVARTLAGRSLE